MRACFCFLNIKLRKCDEAKIGISAAGAGSPIVSYFRDIIILY